MPERIGLSWTCRRLVVMSLVLDLQRRVCRFRSLAFFFAGGTSKWIVVGDTDRGGRATIGSVGMGRRGVNDRLIRLVYILGLSGLARLAPARSAGNWRMISGAVTEAPVCPCVLRGRLGRQGLHLLLISKTFLLVLLHGGTLEILNSF